MDLSKFGRVLILITNKLLFYLRFCFFFTAVVAPPYENANDILPRDVALVAKERCRQRAL